MSVGTEIVVIILLGMIWVCLVNICEYVKKIAGEDKDDN